MVKRVRFMLREGLKGSPLAVPSCRVFSFLPRLSRCGGSSRFGAFADFASMGIMGRSSTLRRFDFPISLPIFFPERVLRALLSLSSKLSRSRLPFAVRLVPIIAHFFFWWHRR